MRGVHFSRSSLLLIRQRQLGCSTGGSWVTVRRPEEWDPSCTASNVDSESRHWFSTCCQQLGQHTSQFAVQNPAAYPTGQVQRWFSSDTGGSKGRGSSGGKFVLPDAFRQDNDGASAKIGGQQQGVSLDGASTGQFEDAGSEKTEGSKKATPSDEGGSSEPVRRPPSSILQEILAASAEESERLGKKTGWKTQNGRGNGSAQRPGARSLNSPMPDLMRMFQPKDSPYENSDGRLFQPRRPADRSQSRTKDAPQADGSSHEDSTTQPDDARSDKTGRVVYLRKKAPRGVNAFVNDGESMRGDEVAENGRATLSLREMFARSKAEAEEEERQKEEEETGQHARNTSKGRGRALAGSDFQQRVLGLPAEGAGASSDRVMRSPRKPRREKDDRFEDEEDNFTPPSFVVFDYTTSPIPQDKARRETPRKQKVDRATYEKMESEREEKELEEGAEETAADIDESEWWAKMAQGWEPQEDELGVPHVPEVEARDFLAMDLEPEYAMETFGVLPELDDPPETKLEDALIACKEELMELGEIEDEATWQAMLKRTLDRTSELEALVKRYDKRTAPLATAKRQHQILGDIHRGVPERGSPQRTPEMVAHVARALLTLEHNCRWPLQQKKAVMTSLVAQLGKYDGSSKTSKSVQSVFG